MGVYLVIGGIFLASFAIGAWLGGRRERGAWRASGAGALVVLAGTLGLVVFLLWAARRGDSFASLAAVSVLAIGLVAASVALAGGYLGMRWRRAGGQAPR